MIQNNAFFVGLISEFIEFQNSPQNPKLSPLGGRYTNGVFLAHRDCAEGGFLINPFGHHLFRE